MIWQGQQPALMSYSPFKDQPFLSGDFQMLLMIGNGWATTAAMM